jgi:hypothetical protein
MHIASSSPFNTPAPIAPTQALSSKTSSSLKLFVQGLNGHAESMLPTPCSPVQLLPLSHLVTSTSSSSLSSSSPSLSSSHHQLLQQHARLSPTSPTLALRPASKRARILSSSNVLPTLTNIATYTTETASYTTTETTTSADSTTIISTNYNNNDTHYKTDQATLTFSDLSTDYRRRDSAVSVSGTERSLTLKSLLSPLLLKTPHRRRLSSLISRSLESKFSPDFECFSGSLAGLRRAMMRAGLLFVVFVVVQE